MSLMTKENQNTRKLDLAKQIALKISIQYLTKNKESGTNQYSRNESSNRLKDEEFGVKFEKGANTKFDNIGDLAVIETKNYGKTILDSKGDIRFYSSSKIGNLVSLFNIRN
jgi:hypothetical protein